MERGRSPKKEKKGGREKENRLSIPGLDFRLTIVPTRPPRQFDSRSDFWSTFAPIQTKFFASETRTPSESHVQSSPAPVRPPGQYVCILDSSATSVTSRYINQKVMSRFSSGLSHLYVLRRPRFVSTSRERLHGDKNQTQTPLLTTATNQPLIASR